MIINGNLKFHTLGAGEIQNAIIERLNTIDRNAAIHSAGRIVFDTSLNVLYLSNGSAWTALATGGDSTAILTEINAIESTLGALVNSDGTTNVAIALTNPYFGGANNLTTALQNLAAGVSGKDALAELIDVQVSSISNRDIFVYDTLLLKWINLPAGSASGVQPYDTDLSSLASLTHTPGNIIYSDATAWFTAPPGTVSGVQPYDIGLANLAIGGTGIVSMNGDTVAFRTLTAPIAGITISNPDGIIGNPTLVLANDLAGLESLATIGLSTRTGDGTWVTRTLAAPAAGFTITNPTGVSGNPTFALSNDLAALEGLDNSGNGADGQGFAVRIGIDTWTLRDILTGSSTRIVVTNGDGVVTAPTIDLAAITDTNTGTLQKITRDMYGRIEGTSPITTADITGLVNAAYVNVTGDTMNSGASLTFVGSGTVTGLPTPVTATDATNKAYVDSLVAGLSWKNATKAATIANIVLVPAPTTIDGITLVSGDRVLVKNQTAPAENGIYSFNGTDLVRATDMDVAAEFAGATAYVTEGIVNANSGWTQTSEIITLGTTAVEWVQFSGSAAYVWGTGLVNSGNTVNVSLGGGIKELPADEVGIDLFNTTTGAIILTDNGTVRSLTSSSQLHLLLPASAGLTQDATGLYVPANGITNSMLLTSTITLDGDDAGTDIVSLGETILFAGTASQGISTAISANQVTITAANASDVQKGVASFSTSDFTVTTGNVVVKAGGIDNNQLAFSSITVTGTTGSDIVSLGESFAIIGGSTPITTISAANSVTISIADATTSTKGLASFDTAQFSVTSGTVSLAATLSDLTDVDGSTDAPVIDNILAWTGTTWSAVDPSTVLDSAVIDDLADVVITSAFDNQALIHNGSNWVNQKIFHVESITIAATTWTVTHNIGVKFVNVTVYDSTDNVIIPQSIVATSTTVTTITFSAAMTGYAVIMGVG